VFIPQHPQLGRGTEIAWVAKRVVNDEKYIYKTPKGQGIQAGEGHKITRAMAGGQNTALGVVT